MVEEALEPARQEDAVVIGGVKNPDKVSLCLLRQSTQIRFFFK